MATAYTATPITNLYDVIRLISTGKLVSLAVSGKSETAAFHKACPETINAAIVIAITKIITNQLYIWSYDDPSLLLFVMKVPRNFSVFVQYILDEWVPPRIRDSRLFMYLPMKLVLRDTTKSFMTFKNTIFTATEAEFSDLYNSTSHVQELQGETDLNEACTEEILKNISSKKVLEVGCGRGYLANKMSKKSDVTACDIVIPDSIKSKYPKIKFVEGNIQSLPFKDNSFDTVVTTHTLEHVQDLPGALQELRRIAKKELIIVVPRQRPYKYTFSLHTQFFPYKWSLENAFNAKDKDYSIKKLGDWYYSEKISKK